MKITIYHGSVNVIEKPIYGYGKIYNDYGLGFYCTENNELAKEWAVKKEIDGYSNKYELDLSELKVLDLSSEKYSILNWIAILLNNRRFELKNEISEVGKKYLLDNYLIDTSSYDIIKGYRADDSYFSYAQAFLNNSISIRNLSKALKLGNLGEQIVLVSKKAFDNLKYIENEKAESSIYYPLRSKRNDKANKEYLNDLNEPFSSDDVFLIDLMRGRM